MFNKSTYKIIRILKPLELFEIMTRGICVDYVDKIRDEIISLRGEWALNNPIKDVNLDLLSLYLSDSGLCLYTTKEEAERLAAEFKSWNLFFDVYVTWYGGSTYKVGFNYSYDAFEALYLEWSRGKKLKQILCC